jgi:hypothetical protein
MQGVFLPQTIPDNLYSRANKLGPVQDGLRSCFAVQTAKSNADRGRSRNTDHRDRTADSDIHQP